MKVTVFVPLLEGLGSNDHAVCVYTGALTLDQIKTIADQLGGINNEGYARSAVLIGAHDTYLITFNGEKGMEPKRAEKGEYFDSDQEGCGDLTYDVYVADVDDPPAVPKKSRRTASKGR